MLRTVKVARVQHPGGFDGSRRETANPAELGRRVATTLNDSHRISRMFLPDIADVFRCLSFIAHSEAKRNTAQLRPSCCVRLWEPSSTDTHWAYRISRMPLPYFGDVFEARTPSRPRNARRRAALTATRVLRSDMRCKTTWRLAPHAKHALVFVCGGVFRYAVTAHWGSPMGADGRQAASTERRPQRGRNPRAADGRVGGVHTMTGRGAAPDFFLRAAPCLALFVHQVQAALWP